MKLIKYYLSWICQAQSKSNNGFTLLELLITVVISGILSTIAISSILNQVPKAKETEAQQNLSQFNKSQTLYFIENGSFTNNFDSLGLGSISNSNSESKFYAYQIEDYTPNLQVELRATPNDSSIKEYKTGIIRETNPLGLSVLNTLLCKNNQTGISNLSVDLNNKSCTNGEILSGN